MEPKIMIKVNAAMSSLDNIADTFGAARSTHIAILGHHLLEIRGIAEKMQAELELLRRFKEEHSEHDDKRNEVSAES